MGEDEGVSYKTAGGTAGAATMKDSSIGGGVDLAR